MNEYDEFWKKHWLTHNKLDDGNPQKQVARTKFGIAITESDWNRTCEYVASQMQLSSTDTLFDLCCGNGLLSKFLINHVNRIYAIDYSSKLLDRFVIDSNKITKFKSDILNFDYSSYKFNRAVMYFSAQHFNEKNLLSIIRDVHKSIDDKGFFFIGDIPNIEKKWEYFYKEEYRNFYFSNIEAGEPSVGVWYEKYFFEYLAEYIGFSDVVIQDQPKFMINSNHRFDVLFIK